MAGLLPQMSLEPAPGYRRFVECRFEALRRDARRLANPGQDVDEVCTNVLADVALRWRWLEILRVWLRRPDPAGAYLGVALARRTAAWRPDPPETRVETDDYREIEVFTDAVPSRWTARPVATSTAPPSAAAPSTAAPSGATSAAVRIAAVRPLAPPPPSAEVEAVIAWLHAHETYERYRRVVTGTAAAIAVAVMFNV
jgi:membrane-associated phospholipid phosphatase